MCGESLQISHFGGITHKINIFFTHQYKSFFSSGIFRDVFALSFSSFFCRQIRE
jgi:hypothetical protein